MFLALCIAGIAGVVIGTFAAALADVFPAHRNKLQDWGGGLLIGSVALLGFAFPMM
jgi:hypothetical protein